MIRSTDRVDGGEGAVAVVGAGEGAGEGVGEGAAEGAFKGRKYECGTGGSGACKSATARQLGCED